MGPAREGRDGRIEIEPAPLPVVIERRARFLVAMPEAGQAGPPFIAGAVEQTRRAVPDECGAAG